MNAPENTDRPENAATSEPATPDDSAATDAATPDGFATTDAATPDGFAATDAAIPEDSAATTAAGDSGDTSIYVRRGRTPTLSFWVALAIALPAVVALISAPFFAFADLGGVFNFMLTAAVLVGLPLAAIVCLVDALRHRTRKSRRR